MVKDITNHPNYSISDSGEVFRKSRSGLRQLKCDWSNGYARVDIDGKKEYVGKMVLETFGPPAKPLQKMFYIDGDKTNNTLENLVWLSPSRIAIYSTYTLEYRLSLFSRGAR